MKKKMLVILTTFILATNIILPIYADDENDELDISSEEVEELLETAANLTEIPTINSRYAIVYDRTSRRNPFWKRGK